MTKKQYEDIKIFPALFVTQCRYISKDTKLKSGDTFVGVKKERIGKDDYSIIDDKGHPHYYDSCGLFYPDDNIESHLKCAAILIKNNNKRPILK